MRIKSKLYTYCPSFLRQIFKKIENSPIGCRLARGVFWSMIGAVISRGLMLVASVYVARILGKTGFGELGMIQSTVGMFGVFAGFGLGLTATKYVAEFRQRDPDRAGRIIGLSELSAIIIGGLMALGLFIFAPWLAENTINAPHLDGVLRIGSVIIFISALNDAQTGALSGFEAFKSIAYVNLFTGLISFPLLVCGVWLGGITGAVWAMAINLGFNWLLNHIALRKEAQRYRMLLTYRNCSNEWPVLWRFSFPAVIASSLYMPVTWLCSALLVNKPNGYSEMGIYNAANQWFVLVAYLPGLLGGVVLPILSERFGQSDIKQSTKLMLWGIKINALLVLPIIAIGSIASPYIMNMYGMAFRSGWPTLVVVLFTAGYMACETPITQILAASGKMWLHLGINLVWALVFIVGTFYLVDLGSFGVVLARASAFVIQSIVIIAFALWLLRKVSRTIDRGNNLTVTYE